MPDGAVRRTDLGMAESRHLTMLDIADPDLKTLLRRWGKFNLALLGFQCLAFVLFALSLPFLRERLPSIGLLGDYPPALNFVLCVYAANAGLYLAWQVDRMIRLALLIPDAGINWRRSVLARIAWLISGLPFAMPVALIVTAALTPPTRVAFVPELPGRYSSVFMASTLEETTGRDILSLRSDGRFSLDRSVADSHAPVIYGEWSHERVGLGTPPKEIALVHLVSQGSKVGDSRTVDLVAARDFGRIRLCGVYEARPLCFERPLGE